MSTGRGKVLTPSEAVALIKDGDLVAIGGHATRGRPMALVREVIRQGRRRLHIAGVNNSIDVDMLVGAGCVETVETADVGMGELGVAQNYRRANKSGSIQIIDHSEKTAVGRFHAASMGAPYLPLKMEPGRDRLAKNPHLRPVTDVFTDEPWMAVEAIRPDVAIIHGHTADEEGNVQLDQEGLHLSSSDILIAKSARTVIVSVEQIVSAEAIKSRPANTILSSLEVTCVVETPYGAHPCSCDGRYTHDQEHLDRYITASATAAGFERWLGDYVRSPADHYDYLKFIGMKRLMEISTKRLTRQ
nr:CoA-transferase [Microvirga sp. KLBC 81]